MNTNVIAVIDAARSEIRHLELLAELIPSSVGVQRRRKESAARGDILRRAEWMRCNVLALEIALWDSQGLR